MPPAAAPAPLSCPSWCDGDHTGDYTEAHRTEVGRVDEGELALVVAIVSQLEPGSPRTVELSWMSSDRKCKDHFLMEAIELEPAEITPFAELIEHANTMLKARPTL
jgi:hypothetical protein